MSANNKIVVRDLSKSFESRDQTFVALDNVNLEIAESEFVSLVGPSGCGKSTLLEIVAGLQAPTSGIVQLDGHDIKGPGPDRTLMFQHYALFPWRRVIDNVAFPLEMAGVKKAERRTRALASLRTVGGLDRFADRHVWQLSGGMQQRVALARALVCEPQVLLMDEPFSGADAITRDLLQEQLLELHRKTRKTILFVTHGVDEALRMSDRIAVMGTRPGRIVDEFRVTRDASGSDGKAELRDHIWTLLRKEIRQGNEEISVNGSTTSTTTQVMISQ